MSKVSLKHVYKVYEGGVRAVNDFNLDIKDKEFIVFVGPSGCGKSTTLRMIAGLETITAGQLYIDDACVNDVESKDRDIAMVFQNYALYPHMTVYQNMAFGLKLRKEDPKEIDERVKKAAEILEITDLLSRKPKALSGGQRQRVALGRAIVREPKVFLLDEPLSNLDAKLRVQMRLEITKLHKKLATTFIYVTHDQTEAMTMGDRIVVMKLGYVQQVDTPVNLYENPANLFVATFLGSPQMNILPCHLEVNKGVLRAIFDENPKLSSDFPALKAKQLSDPAYLGKPLLFGIRPEHIHLAEEGIPGTIDVVEQLGDESLLYIKVDGFKEDLIIKATALAHYEAKQSVHLLFAMDKSHLFDKESEQSILGVPLENAYPCCLQEHEIRFGKNVLAMSPSFEHRLLTIARQEKALRLSFSPEKVGLEKSDGALEVQGVVDFVEERNDSSAVYLKMEGLASDLVFIAKAPATFQNGDKVNVYIKEEDITLSDNDGTRLLSREEILPNIIKAECHQEGEKTTIRFGGLTLRVPRLEGAEGSQTLELAEDKVKVLFSKKKAKELEKPFVASPKDSVIPASAYDEDQLGKKNAIFVKIPGLDHYATFVVPADFSVYHAPKFDLMLEDGAFTIVK